MPVTENLAVQMHQQDTDYYCGAACAQMVLETIGAGLLDQDDLYADNHSHSTLDAGVNWATGPDGLQWTLMDRRPPAFTNYFALYALDTEDLISRKLCWTIRHYRVAPIALVYGWAHWITVRGYTASAHPASSADNTYTIEAFDINNPWPPSPSFDTPALAPPPPHNIGDGCGTGGDRGLANEHVTYATWQSTYMTGVPGATGTANLSRSVTQSLRPSEAARCAKRRSGAAEGTFSDQGSRGVRGGRTRTSTACSSARTGVRCAKPKHGPV